MSRATWKLVLLSTSEAERLFTAIMRRMVRVVPITIVILIALFAIQFRGTATVSKLFGPICAVWFLAIGGLVMILAAEWSQLRGRLEAAQLAFLLRLGQRSAARPTRAQHAARRTLQRTACAAQGTAAQRRRARPHACAWARPRASASAFS